jgi:hypothetical protein
MRIDSYEWLCRSRTSARRMYRDLGAALEAKHAEGIDFDLDDDIMTIMFHRMTRRLGWWMPEESMRTIRARFPLALRPLEEHRLTSIVRELNRPGECVDRDLVDAANILVSRRSRDGSLSRACASCETMIDRTSAWRDALR